MRDYKPIYEVDARLEFPFLFGGTFIEGDDGEVGFFQQAHKFPFLFGGTFIEGPVLIASEIMPPNFPSFSEGLSLRDDVNANLG